MKQIITLVMLLCLSTLAYAQSDVRSRGSGGQAQPTQPQSDKRHVTGKVVDANGEPIIGATVTVIDASTKNVIVGGFTNANGEFDLAVDGTANRLLRVTYVGFKVQEVNVDQQSQSLTVSMQEDVTNLDDVVVVGYGESSRRGLTGSLSKVDGAQIQNLPVNSMEGALQGRMAGVAITSNSGKLGQGIQVRVRGNSSVTASNQPLYVVDGQPITTENLETLTGEATNPIADINFNDVESIEVLKDAAASAIYGARASNGVVLITTKRGKVGRTTVDLNYYYGVSNPTRLRQYLNGDEYVQLTNAAGVTDGIQWIQPYNPAGGPINYANGDYIPGQYTDWQKQIYKANAPIQQVDVAVRGGTEKTQFFLSTNFNEQYGIVIGNRFTRTTGLANVDHSVTDKIRVGVKMNIIRTFNDRLLNDNSFATFGQQVAFSPLTPLNDPTTGRPWLNDPWTTYDNPLSYVGNSFTRTEVLRSISSVYAQFELIQGLQFRTELAFDLIDQRENQWYSAQVNNGRAGNGFAYQATSRVSNYNTRNYVTYTKTFGQSNVNVVGGFEITRSRNEFGSVTGQGLPTGAFQGITSAARITGGSGSATEYSFYGSFLRASYRLKDRYLLGLTGRYDGSSRFGTNNRFGFFPSVSLGWILSEEDFIKSLGFVSYLKLRTSYGLTGNAEIGNFSRLSPGFASAYKLEAGVIQGTNAGNDNLKWETTAQFDIGLELNLFNDRVSFVVDYYRKDTRDLLLSLQLPSVSGSQTGLANVGNLRNYGIEFTVATDNLREGKVRWRSELQFSFNDNVVTNLNGQIITAGRASVNRAAEGFPLGVFWTPKWYGVDPANGNPLWIGADGVTPTNVYPSAASALGMVGRVYAPWNYGFRNTVRAFGFDVEVFFQGASGNQIYNSAGIFMTTQFSNGQDNQTRDVMNYWRQPGDITSTPRATFLSNLGARESSRYVYDASYIRLKTVTIGYSLKEDWVRVVKLRSARVYTSMQNLITWTRYPSDPEVSSLPGANIGAGQDFYTLPQAQTFIFGVNLGF